VRGIEENRQTVGWLRWVYHFPNFCKLIRRLFGDRRVPSWSKALVMFSGLYLLFPMDFWFDWYPAGLGYLDDLVVLGLAVRTFFRSIPREVLMEHVKRIDAEDPRRD